MKQGLIQLYTGDGKGKTTAAVGLAVRASAHNLRVCFIYFHKDPDRWGYGEFTNLKKLGVDLFGFAPKHPYLDKDASNQEIRAQCLSALKFIQGIFEQKRYDVVILDEINICVRDGFLSEEEVLELMQKKPPEIELVLTGRGATQKMIEKADLVSEVSKIKHPFDKGISGRKGIEY